MNTEHWLQAMGPKQLGQSVSYCKLESWVPGLTAARGPIQLETKTAPCEDSITPEDSLTDLIGSKMVLVGRVGRGIAHHMADSNVNPSQ